MEWGSRPRLRGHRTSRAAVLPGHLGAVECSSPRPMQTLPQTPGLSTALVSRQTVLCLQAWHGPHCTRAQEPAGRSPSAPGNLCPHRPGSFTAHVPWWAFLSLWAVTLGPRALLLGRPHSDFVLPSQGPGGHMAHGTIQGNNIILPSADQQGRFYLQPNPLCYAARRVHRL